MPRTKKPKDTRPDWLRTESGVTERWLHVSANPPRWGGFLKPSGLSDRRRRLFAVQCCRSPKVWELMRDDRSKSAVVVAELYSDGLATEQERRDAYVAAQAADAYAAAAYAEAAAAEAAEAAEAAAAAAAAATAYADTASAAAQAAADAAYAAYAAYAEAAEAAEAGKWQWEYQAAILVAMIRPEWRWDESWNTPTASALAEAIYVGKEWGNLPILADAIEEAGCDDPRILGHARTAEHWFRGEWLLDRCTGRK